MNIQQFKYVLAVAEYQHFELAAEKCHHVHFKQQDLVVSEFNEPAIDLKNLPITFHFPKNYEEHLPMRSGITLNEIARRICISLLPVSLFLLATAAGIQRNLRSETKEVIPFLLIGIFTYFIYLIVRSMNQSLPLVYLSIPLIPIPLTVYKLSRDLR